MIFDDDEYEHRRRLLMRAQKYWMESSPDSELRRQYTSLRMFLKIINLVQSGVLKPNPYTIGFC